ncbi:MAG: ubiquinol-cytochrome c reductase iron-sulfur subunit [Pseudomonadota bacterium]
MTDNVMTDQTTTDDMDASRRRFISIATAGAGAVATGLFAVPFLGSLKPSARAQALGAPVQINIESLQPGQVARAQWRGRTVYVVRRDEDMLERVAKMEPQLADPGSAASDQPEYAVNEFRSVKPEVLVVFGQCTHLGCAPAPRFDVQPADLGSEWFGGFFCACHGSKFDMAGRVLAGVPAPKNLEVPPYRFVGESVIEVGTDTGAA